ncbi:MAG: FGGY family carbohydrate kinase [Bacteroidota bacterium]
MYTVGLDIGSSSIKAALVSIESADVVHRVQIPDNEMPIMALQEGWAEQDPDLWWDYVCQACRRLIEQSGISVDQIKTVGIAYQMHGLVLVDDQLRPVRPAIIWCDSRAGHYGEQAFKSLGEKTCLDHCLNNPGNFTAAKLKWVAELEPENYARAKHMLLPGDYIALKLSGQVNTTTTGLSEAILWDFKQGQTAHQIIKAMDLNPSLIPELVPSVGKQAVVNKAGELQTGIPAGAIIGYRAGDQPNNALSLGVVQPGEVAATCGTSGVIYAIGDRLIADSSQQTNAFAHVNHTQAEPRIGHLLCVNGAGILHRWIRDIIADDSLSYDQMERMANEVNVGADGLSFLPFGNGAERMFNNRIVGAHLIGLQLNRHKKSHLIRAGLEGIAFAFVYGMKGMQKLGISLQKIRAGDDNLFQSSIFARTIATLTDTQIEIYHTTGAVGAAIAASTALHPDRDLTDVFKQQKPTTSVGPAKTRAPIQKAYAKWLHNLEKLLQAN